MWWRAVNPGALGLEATCLELSRPVKEYPETQHEEKGAEGQTDWRQMDEGHTQNLGQPELSKLENGLF